MDTTADCHYDDRLPLAADLAATVNKEFLALVDASCRYIQVDEPLFARQVEEALGFGMQEPERCFHNMPDHVTRVVHICCGYPDYLDDEDYRKADPQSYHRLAGAMDALPIHQVSIEDAHCCNDLELLGLFQNKAAILGSVAVARSRIETIDEVVERIRAAQQHIDRDRLVIAPDCGLRMLTRDLAVAKLGVM